MRTLSLVLAALLVPSARTQDTPPSPWDSATFQGLELRNIGPALMSGRIADIAIHPGDDSIWFVAVASGGVWKTTNAGITWTPVFDEQESYSIGCVTIDPNDPNVVWVGTGENVGGRHVGFGDGVYRSVDGGATWTNTGLRDSQHISKIIVHPHDSSIVWVAAQGPLWTPGGERGVYRTEDGGGTWTRTLGDEEWVGATELAIDPRDPERLYAATWQRHRTVAAYLGGGPGSGLHRSDDGGRTWRKLSKGLPESRLGKIGLAISPQRPDVLYAAIELDRREGAVYRSTDGGGTWEKRSDAVSGATGPHYYQELYACPHRFDRIYLVDVRIQVSDDGGKTFSRLTEEHKHSDNHAISFRADDPDYLLVGTDGGLYESFDLGRNWRFFANLPVTQFYKVAVDDAAPFYTIYGGTQDNSTQGGPSRTDDVHGIRNADWRVVLDWDGHQPATEPGNPDIVYAQRQQGQLSRIDTTTGEVVDIQPQPAEGEDYERFNWDAPILVSPHAPTRIYFASQRVWHSDDRGDSWRAISGDLTRDEERLALPIMGTTQSWDNAWDVSAMSNYNTITSLAESPLQEGLLYVGTDDGRIQVTEDGGENWRAIEVGSLPDVPERAFVNDVKADLFDADAVFVALDDHKSGSFRPFLLRSTDRGRSWRSICGNLPDRTLVWRLVQDHVDRDLLFAGTETGVYFTVDGGTRWTELTGGVPTIPFRDLVIQRREDDLVGASFGRGLFVLDDISPLRDVSAEQLATEAALFQPRDAWWYVPRPVLGFGPGKGDQGASYFVAPNPPFGAVFTYYLRDGLKSAAEQRQAREKLAAEKKEPASFPGWDAVEAEHRGPKPRIWLTVRDADGRTVRRVEGPTGRGFHRVAWDLRYPRPEAIELTEAPVPEFENPPRGLLAPPGRYTVTLSREVDGEVVALAEPREFEVLRLHRGALKGADATTASAFWRTYEDAVRAHTALTVALARLTTKGERLQAALANTAADVGPLDATLFALRRDLASLDARLNGGRARRAIGEKTAPTIQQRLSAVSLGIDRSTYGPTATHRRSLEIAQRDLDALRVEVEACRERARVLGTALIEAGAPWVEGDPLPAAKRR